MRQLQADDHEDEAIEDEGEGIPDSPSLDANASGEKLGALAAEIETTSHNGEHAGSMNRFGGEIHGVGNDDADGDFDGAVFDAALEPCDDQGDEQTKRDASDNKVSKFEQAFAEIWPFAADNHSESELQSEETPGIVEQAFTFEHLDDAL